MSAAPRPARPPVDWTDVRRRMERLRLAVERGWQPEAEEAARILRQRAQLLARRPIAAAPGQSLQVIEFQLAGERYAIESRYVGEVFPLTELTSLPCTPDFVRGIVNVRGEIVSVVDLRIFFELSAPGLSDLNKLIVLHCETMSFGILADAVGGARELPLAQIQPPLPTLTGVRDRYLRGVTPDPLTLLDGARLLADRSLVVDRSVA